jgi:hypothetical protein
MDERELSIRHYFAQPTEYAFMRAPGKWLRDTEMDAAERLDQIERNDGYSLGQHLTATAQMIVHTEPLRPLAVLDLDPSSIPDRRHTFARALMHLLPYEISGDVLHGGWDVAYRPTFGYAPWHLGLIVPISPWIWRRSTSETFQMAGLGLHLAVPRVVVTGFDAFAKEQCRWWLSKPCTLGAEAAIYLLAGKLRVAGSIDAFDNVHFPDTFTIRVGIADINGLLYWGARHAFQ